MPRTAAILLVIVVGAVAWFAGRASVPESKRAAVDRAEVKTEDPEYKIQIDRLSRELDGKRDELIEAQARINELESRAEQATAPPAAEPDSEPSKPRFVYEKESAVLNEVDWKVVGESTAHLQPLLGKLTVAVREGKDVRTMTEEIGSIQRWNGPLVTQALKMSNSGLSGYATNGAFTHPSIVVNQVFARLREAGKPLTAEQERFVGELGTRFIAAEAKRVASYGDATLEAQKLLDESLLKEELYAEIDKLLTADQREALHPADLRGLMKADLFSSGLVWLQVAGPLPFPNRATFAAAVATRLAQKEQIPAAHTDAVKSVVDEWVAQLPDAFLAKPFAAEIGLGFMKVSDIIESARHLIKLREALIRSIPDEAARKKIRAGVAVIVPYLRAG
ncbi:MAG: hypothetical protein ACYS0E_13955 [Planctomycetota bacterium]|jgi:hypothetical protein